VKEAIDMAVSAWIGIRIGGVWSVVIPLHFDLIPLASVLFPFAHFLPYFSCLLALAE